MLGLAIAIAATAHKDQKTRDGMPYILHPLEVMNNVNTTQEKCVAVLHDVLEDTHITEDYLREYFSDEIVDAVVSLTKLDGESRMDAAKRVAKNKLGIVVKLADLEHNMDLSRLPMIKPKDLERQKEYIEVKKFLEMELQKCDF